MDQEIEIGNSKPETFLSTPRGPIYHYTSQSGLLGILKNKHIWASHLRFLNDTREYLVGRAFIQRIHSLMREIKQADETTTVLVDRLLSEVDRYDIYVASFAGADAGDSLDLWRGYARTTPGYSIGFSGEALARAVASKTTDRPQLSLLRSVRYIPQLDNQDKMRLELLPLASLIRSLISQLRQTHFDQLTDANEDFGDLVSAINKASQDYAKIEMFAALLLPLFKDEGFASEQESRLVQVRAEHNRSEHRKYIDFHLGQSSIVPHVPIDLPSGDLGIIRIIVGPCPDPKWAVRAVEMLLDKYGVKVHRIEGDAGVEVVHSKIPYRNW